VLRISFLHCQSQSRNLRTALGLDELRVGVGLILGSWSNSRIGPPRPAAWKLGTAGVSAVCVEWGGQVMDSLIICLYGARRVTFSGTISKMLTTLHLRTVFTYEVELFSIFLL